MDDLAVRAQQHAAMGEPARLAIVDELWLGDVAPGELAARLDLPGNLLAHHLDVLEAAGLIERLVSRGDRRRRYVRLLGDALPSPRHEHGRPPGRMLFVCSRNMARSQLAAALWRQRTGGAATSAGTRPAARIHPRARSAAARHGLDLPDVAPRRLDLTDGSTALARVVTVCDRAHEELDATADWLHWSIADPVEDDTDAAFDATIGELDARIRHLAGMDDS